MTRSSPYRAPLARVTSILAGMAGVAILAPCSDDAALPTAPSVNRPALSIVTGPVVELRSGRIRPSEYRLGLR